MATPNINRIDDLFGDWIKAGDLLVNLYSLETGFKDAEKRRREIWDFIEWRETILVGPPDPTCRTAPVI